MHTVYYIFYIHHSPSLFPFHSALPSLPKLEAFLVLDAGAQADVRGGTQSLIYFHWYNLRWLWFFAQRKWNYSPQWKDVLNFQGFFIEQKFIPTLWTGVRDFQFWRWREMVGRWQGASMVRNLFELWEKNAGFPQENQIKFCGFSNQVKSLGGQDPITFLREVCHLIQQSSEPVSNTAQMVKRNPARKPQVGYIKPCKPRDKPPFPHLVSRISEPSTEVLHLLFTPISVAFWRGKGTS